MIQHLPKKIIWLDGQWITHPEKNLLLFDRGITLGDGIFETILIQAYKPQLLDAHLQRWSHSASLLDMAQPPDKDLIEKLINEALAQKTLAEGNGALRITWSRGITQNRGINKFKKDFSSHTLWLEINEYTPRFQPISTMISNSERRNEHSRISQCKAISYIQSIMARNESNHAGYDDALLLNTNDEMCCGTTANIIIKRKDRWLTPRITSGCLPGIMRKQGLESGLLEEAKINAIPEINDQWLLINSLSCHSITQIGRFKLSEFTRSKELWHNLLKKSPKKKLAF